MDAIVCTGPSVTSDSRGSHPTTEAVTVYLDGRATDSERTDLERHLADCPACRREVVEVSEVVASARPRRTRTWAVGAATGLLAAGLAGVLLFVARPEAERPQGAAVLRDAGMDVEAVAQLRVVAPPADAVLGSDGVAFAWRPVGGEAFYRVTLTDRNGDVVWRGETADTSLQLPSGSGLRRGSSYFWYVDALLPDGTSVTSGIRAFRTSP